MEKIFEIMLHDPSVARIVESYAANNRQTWAYGVTGTQKTALIAAAFQSKPRPTVIVTANRQNNEQYRADLAAFLPDASVVELPVVDVVTFTVAAKSVELAAQRMDVLSRMVRGETVIILASVEAAIQQVQPREEFEKNRITLSVNSPIRREQLIADLVSFRYERVDQIEGLGQFSVRGGIIDIFPVNRNKPLRLELFGDEVDSLREFDVVSQRSEANVNRCDIMPLTEPDHNLGATVFLSYLPQESTVIFDEPTRIREQIVNLIKENPDMKRRTFDWGDMAAVAQKFNIVYLSLMLQKAPHTKPNDIISITAKSIAPFHRQMDILENELDGWYDRRYAIAICMSSSEKAGGLRKSLAGESSRTIYTEDMTQLAPGKTVIVNRTISTGFELPNARLVVLTEKDIFGRQKKRPRARISKERQITYFRDINIGDYVVHVNHGIGKYIGVETLDVGGVHKDYLLIKYAGEDKLYVPTDQVQLLQKYIGAEGEAPRLSKMGGSDWLKAKTRAKAAVVDLAKELVALYAERQIAPGFAFDSDTPWQKEFEDAFPFEETPDQLTALAEIKVDMEKPRPMDRLLCGDVGFGKTEVAIRAAFKAVMANKQVAVLVPTTVLAQQHFQTFSQRFGGFGPTVDMVSRFRTHKEQRETLLKVAEGKVDILIGTHRILNSDVTFKDLGLLIVDEEQRFGVAQKEKLKKWSSHIDVLTLSATPIPRTLHMSLVGARDMSVIETPPEERYPVQTYVVEYSDEIIREAIKRELKRGGQVYFVYNRVQTIDKMAEHLADMLPDARIKTAHGQMPEDILEQVMLDFYEGEDDVLVCTSIIENGLDVSNANTIIVYDADRFGLSQLYQMRGRVGRSRRMAFAYFTYRRDKVLTEVAEKRLQAIKEFAELGAGFKIAMRDLEIRGAGNLLGPQQHGHIVSVGFEMYCRLLDEAVEEIKTGKAADIPVEPVLEMNVEAYLSGDYIGDAMHKIEIYQRVAAVRNDQQADDLLDELIDRFGEPPQTVLNLIAVARIKNASRRLGIKSLIQHPSHIEAIFSDHPRVHVENVMKLKKQYPLRVVILQGPPASIHFKNPRMSDKDFLAWICDMLEILEERNS